MGYFPGVSEIRLDGRGEAVIHAELDYNDLAAGAAAVDFLIPVKAGTFVDEVQTVVVTAFDGSTPAVKIGDTSTSAGYLASADIAPATGATAGACVSSKVKTEAYQGGKYYAVDDNIRVNYTPSATYTAGRLLIKVKLSSVYNDGLSA